MGWHSGKEARVSFLWIKNLAGVIFIEKCLGDVSKPLGRLTIGNRVKLMK